MLRIVLYSGLLAASLTGVAHAADRTLPQVNRAEEFDSNFQRRDNQVGGSVRNLDGSITNFYQNGRGSRATSDPSNYNEDPTASYNGGGG